MNSSTEKPTLASEYDFRLPKHLIAQQPAQNREDARLMVVDRASQQIHHSHVRNLGEWLDPGDCLVLNETRVLMAKLVGHRTQTGGRWQGLYLDHEPETGIVKVMAKTRGNIQVGETVTLQDREGVDRMQLVLLARLDSGTWAVKPEPPIELPELLEKMGRVPLPHYIRDGNMTDADVHDYQTVYASSDGSIAAPTAGLHFTQRLLNQIIDRGINICKLTLHVGTGTFRPISTEVIESHAMHAEYGSIDQSAIDLIRETKGRNRRIVAVGTTSMRLLETVGQQPEWGPWHGETDLFIKPGHQFRIADAMITNFHLPRTTLLVLVRTFGGDTLMKEAYREAIEQKYRFFSYGDAMLIR